MRVRVVRARFFSMDTMDETENKARWMVRETLSGKRLKACAGMSATARVGQMTRVLKANLALQETVRRMFAYGPPRSKT